MALARGALAPVCGFVFAAATAIAGAALPGCGSSGGDDTFGAVDGGGDDATGGGDGGVVPSFDASHGTATALAIAPANAQLLVTDLNAPPKLQLTANATYADGTVAPVSASWTLDRPDVAGIGAGTGLLTATGAVFGVVTVTAKTQTLAATATITVSLKAAINPGNVSGGDQQKLGGATAPDTKVTAWAYPYDRTVFPRGLLAPEEMWNGGVAGDAYSIELVAPAFDLTIYVKADPPSRFTMPQAIWNSLTTTAKSADVQVKLRRLSGGTAYVGPIQTWHVADANLRGTIYYWAINEGQIKKIDLTTGQRSNVFDSGPSNAMGAPTPLNAGNPRNPPWQDTGTGKRCVACHSVSKDGSTLTSVFSRDSSTGPLGFVDPSGATITAIGDYETGGTFDALTPDGKLAVVNYGSKTMQLLSSATGQPIASALDGLTNVCDPVFSPDGSRFAMAGSCDPGFGYPVEFRTSNLVLYDFTQATSTFANPRTVVTSNGVGDAIAFPSFTPDSNFIVFQRGDYARAKYGDNSKGQYFHGNDDLFVAAAKPGAPAIALDAANGKGYIPNDSAHLNYAPTVNPISEGGYVWVVFTTPRDYGNEMQSPQGAPPSDATYANRKQLWVTAVDANVGATDPSHPAFWLPGQDPASANMFGYWSLAKCKPTQADGGPSSCSAGFECCSGFCRDSGQGPVCVDPPPGCHQVGEKCTSAADCCNGGSTIDCIGGFCQKTRVN